MLSPLFPSTSCQLFFWLKFYLWNCVLIDHHILVKWLCDVPDLLHFKFVYLGKGDKRKKQFLQLLKLMSWLACRKCHRICGWRSEKGWE